MTHADIAEDTTQTQAAAPVRQSTTPAFQASRSLSEAVAAVNDHCLRTELRRLKHTQQIVQARADSSITVQRSTLDDMRSQLVAAAALRQLVEQGPLVVVAFDASAPHALREAPTALARTLGCEPQALYGRSLQQLFAAGDAVRLQQALRDADGAAVTLVLQLRAFDGASASCCLHLLPPDPAQPDVRWACLMRLPQDDSMAERPAARRPLVKPVLRSRADNWPPATTPL
jgi:hypothetical protein